MTETGAPSSKAVLTLLSALPLPSAALAELVLQQSPFAHPSRLPTSAVNKFLARLNAAVGARDPGACELAGAIIEQDTEGYASAQSGKNWMGAALGALAAPATPVSALPAYLSLAGALVAAAPFAPTLEREVVQPSLGKLAISLSRLVERLVPAAEWAGLHAVLAALRTLLIANPAPFRPTTATLRSILTALLLRIPPALAPEPIILAAAETLAVFHLVAGKAGAPAAWGADVKDALGGFAAGVAGLAADAWAEEAPRATPFPSPATLPPLPVDPTARAEAAIAWVEGYTELVLALLRLPSARPVPVPLVQVVSCALRAVNLTFETPVAEHVSPVHHAALLSAIPRLNTAGLLLLGQAALSCGDHLLPHLTAILEHTVYLLETTPSYMADARAKLLLWHTIWLEQYPAAILPTEYVTRLLRFALGVIGTALDSKPTTAVPVHQGKRGKKRGRGAEDALVGGLEGRAPKPVSKADAEVILAALELTPLLHSAPLLSPALLNFSIRLHLSLFLSLPGRIASFADKASHLELERAVTAALEHVAIMNEGSGGTSRDIRVLLLSLLPTFKTEASRQAFSLLLHPALPPMARPLPPLSQLHYFAPESDEEKKIRREMGFFTADEVAGGAGQDESDDEEMAVDDWASAPPAKVQVVAAAAAVAAPAPVFVPAPVVLPVVQAAPVVQQAAQPLVQPLAVQPVAPAPPVVTEASVAATPAASFMSAPSASSSKPVAPEPAAAPASAPAAADDDEDDDMIPELDSGSEDDDEDDDDE
ncbi:uncharacterized protein LOC62_04G006299 [Vanrija pseudolonga]|uniref:Pre-rRNA-processing protein RIX1 n=1 Tax=Vanrija pseudolonga TaxID=143232 RepID=A0AAF1BRZ7_9TREE|nr:hypothetical protein LOC62_04G006299 [Vanrija pseudolonga]